METDQLKPHELRIGNYVQVKGEPGRIVRILGIRPGLMLDPPLETNYLVDVVDLRTRKYGHGWSIRTIEPISIEPYHVIEFGFEPQPAGTWLSEWDQSFVWPSDADSYWVATIDANADLCAVWLFQDEDHMCVAMVRYLHQLQNVLYGLEEGTQLRLNCDQDSIAHEVADKAINGSSVF